MYRQAFLFQYSIEASLVTEQTDLYDASKARSNLGDDLHLPLFKIRKLKPREVE